MLSITVIYAIALAVSVYYASKWNWEQYTRSYTQRFFRFLVHLPVSLLFILFPAVPIVVSTALYFTTLGVMSAALIDESLLWSCLFTVVCVSLGHVVAKSVMNDLHRLRMRQKHWLKTF
jgi:hypothetical protein